MDEEYEESLESLQQLDPSPIDSPEEEVEKQLSPSPPRRASTFGSNHGMIFYLSRFQRYSSYVFTVYTGVHLINTSILPLCTQSVPAAEQYLLLFRPFYQSPLLEPLVVTLPLAVHVTSGFLLRLHRRNQAIRRYGSASLPPPATGSQIPKRSHHGRQLSFWPTLSYTSISGYILAPLVLGHTFVNRLLPWWFEGNSSGIGLGFVSHGFAKHPVIAWTGYTALIGVAAGHIVWGWAKWLNYLPAGSDRKKNKRRKLGLNASSAALAAVWAAGGMGVVGRAGKATGWIASGYDELYAQIPFVDL